VRCSQHRERSARARERRADDAPGSRSVRERREVTAKRRREPSPALEPTNKHRRPELVMAGRGRYRTGSALRRLLLASSASLSRSSSAPSPSSLRLLLGDALSLSDTKCCPTDGETCVVAHRRSRAAVLLDGARSPRAFAGSSLGRLLLLIAARRSWPRSQRVCAVHLCFPEHTVDQHHVAPPRGRSARDFVRLDHLVSPVHLGVVLLLVERLDVDRRVGLRPVAPPLAHPRNPAAARPSRQSRHHPPSAPAPRPADRPERGRRFGPHRRRRAARSNSVRRSSLSVSTTTTTSR